MFAPTNLRTTVSAFREAQVIVAQTWKIRVVPTAGGACTVARRAAAIAERAAGSEATAAASAAAWRRRS